MKITVRIQIIKVYDVTVEAVTSEEGLAKVEGMQSVDIAEVGTLKDITTEFAEVI